MSENKFIEVNRTKSNCIEVCDFGDYSDQYDIEYFRASSNIFT
jgi:hypothetical protein